MREYSVSVERLVSRGRIDLVSPSMNDGCSVEVIEVGEDPRFEFLLGRNTNVAKHGSSHLGEEALHQIEPRAMFRGRHKGEAALWLGGQPLLGFLGSVGRVVVEDHFDGGVRRII